MTDYIAFCGLDCEQCEARIAIILMQGADLKANKAQDFVIMCCS